MVASFLAFLQDLNAVFGNSRLSLKTPAICFMLSSNGLSTVSEKLLAFLCILSTMVTLEMP